MSHVATAWAFDIRYLPPSTKIVLLNLADCHNPEHGCFPSQAYLADVCEMSERSVRNHLTKLEELGLITRQRREKAGTQFRSDRYELHFDRALTEAGKPAAKFAGRQKKPAAKYDKSQRQNLPPNLVKEIGNNARDAQAREASSRPIPHAQKCIPSGSSFEQDWDRWLVKRGYPPLSQLSTPIGDGWDAPWTKPPLPDDSLANMLTEKWIAWCLDQRPQGAT